MEIITNTYHLQRPPVATPGQFTELDMGCGKGGFTLALAARFPDRIILGSDVMLGRLSRIEKKAQRQGLGNLTLLRAESLQLVTFQLPVACLDRVHILCPDPWPKKNHVGHRLITTEFLCRLQRVLKPGAIVHLSTDYAPYFSAWLEMFSRFSVYTDAPGAIDDVADLKTDFEKMWLAQGVQVQHLVKRYQG